ncbi:MAG: NAD(P)/FAD-dependent oxidoreductase [Opitutae bacterium]|nr:NAD(P)/FAD-dependent oxidoreductase [Opitutae bacterium]
MVLNRDAKQIVVVGGGAAGYFCALTAAGADPSAKVILLEAGSQLLRKVKVSGGGRCNLTHHCYDPKELSTRYPRGAKELRGAFHHFQPRDTISWFESRGVKTKVESDGRIFPMSDDSQSVIDCLLGEACRLKVVTRKNSRVTGIERKNDRWAVEINREEIIDANRVCLALGSLKGTGMEDILIELGHTLSPLLPSLFAFNLPEHPLKELAGLSVPHATACISPSGKAQSGPLLITHRGLSGPCILRLSAWEAEALAACGYQFEVLINWLGNHSVEKTREEIHSYRKDRAVAQVGTNPRDELPKRLWTALVSQAGIAKETTWAHLSKDGEKNLLKALIEYRAKVQGKTTNKEEFVTCGGVSLKEVDFRTMESKLAPGLHFAGECLDFDGITGGFNFQAAWTTGRIAGLAIVKNS